MLARHGAAIHGLAHITGEGIPGNLPRVLPKGRCAALDKKSWPVPAIFPWLQKGGDIDEAEMFTVFNMGIGFTMVVAPTIAADVQRRLETEHGVATFVLGEVVAGDDGVVWR